MSTRGSSTTVKGKEIPTSISSVKTKYLPCRTFGHAWGLIGTRRADDLILFDLSCINCQTTRCDVIAKANGALEGRTYHYPDGYLKHGAIRRTAWRYEFIKRIEG